MIWVLYKLQRTRGVKLYSFAVMLLTILTLSCFALGKSDEGSADVIRKNLCYGSYLSLPSDYTPPLFRGRMYFTPSKKGGSRNLVMENGELKDPRFKSSGFSVTLPDLTERDEGTFSISFGDEERLHDVFKLKILECADNVRRYYKDTYSCNAPTEAELLEFTPIFSLDSPRVLWNRSNPQTNKGSRGRMKRNVWTMLELTQADNGFYNFRKKDNTLVSRIQLIITEYTAYFNRKVKEQLLMIYPYEFDQRYPYDMTFTPKGNKTRVMLMKAGYLVEDNLMSEKFDFIGRIHKMSEGIGIDPVESTDSGVFEFIDQEGGLALAVQVEVDDEYIPAYVYVAIIVGMIFVVIVCCCCLKKCCCKKSSAKSQSTPQTAAAPAVCFHNTNQPGGPTSSVAPPASAYSYQPLNPLGTREPTREPTTSLGSPVAVPGGQGAAPALSIGSDCLSSDSGPKYELKGMKFPSAPPLSSDSAYCDVYTSDKFNFM